MLLEEGAWTWADGYHAPTLLSFNIVLPAMYLVTMQAFVDQDPICLNPFASAYRTPNRGSAMDPNKKLQGAFLSFAAAK